MLLASENAFLHTYLEGYSYCKTEKFNSKINVNNETQSKNQALKKTNLYDLLSKARY